MPGDEDRSPGAAVAMPGLASGAGARLAARGTTALTRLEDAAIVIVLLSLVVVPIVELSSREVFGTSLPGGSSAVQYLTLWITFLGAALAARSDRLLALATTALLSERRQAVARIFTGFGSVAVAGLLAVASVELIRVDMRFGSEAVWGIPVWCVSLVMPIALATIAWRAAWHASTRPARRLLAATGLVLPFAFLLVPEGQHALALWPAGLLLLAATGLGLPLYAALGGAALLFGWADGAPLSSVPGESYRLSTSPLLPAIPLFTLGGYALSAGGASRRLLRLFSALVGWMPGGLAVVVVLLLAFFTPLTGASGITIVALGGLLLPMLVQAGYTRRNAVGLLTVSGSIGIFIPPSLPVLLYAFYADVPIKDLFIAGAIPGLLLVVGIAGLGAARGWAGGAARTTFRLGEVGAALWEARWEVAMPFLLLWAMFSGFATLVEAAALMVVYAIVVGALAHRELDLRRDLPDVVVQSATLVGGFMIILCVALAFTNYLTLAQVPAKLLAWVQSFIVSPWAFLLALNLFLILVGAMMDIYSAIIVVVPLIVPMIAAYGLSPLHVGAVFLANMEIGYLMPPMGENLFLSAYRFDETLPSIYRSVLPFVAVLVAVVLVITYFPALTLETVRLLR
jgi:C4-dicarboxylate transporter DctM subunit